MRDRGEGGMHGRGHMCSRGACVVGGIHDGGSMRGGACMTSTLLGRYYGNGIRSVRILLESILVIEKNGPKQVSASTF